MKYTPNKSINGSCRWHVLVWNGLGVICWSRRPGIGPLFQVIQRHLYCNLICKLPGLEPLNLSDDMMLETIQLQKTSRDCGTCPVWDSTRICQKWPSKIVLFQIESLHSYFSRLKSHYSDMQGCPGLVLMRRIQVVSVVPHH